MLIMIATKTYDRGSVWVDVSDGEWSFRLEFYSEKQMKRLGECLLELERTGGRAVSIGEE